MIQIYVISLSRVGWGGLPYESPNEREYKTVLDSGSKAMNWSEFWISLVDFGFFVSGTWKPIAP